MRRREATGGTGRSGGTAEANREAGAATNANIDNIINQDMVEGQKEGARGLESTGNAYLSNALSLLGIGSGAVDQILRNATESRPVSEKIHNDSVAGYGEALGSILGGFGF